MIKKSILTEKKQGIQEDKDISLIWERRNEESKYDSFLRKSNRDK